jgi:hypothetical protein
MVSTPFSTAGFAMSAKSVTRISDPLSVHLIQPDKSYWRNQNKEPGRWPSPPN